ncbi:hypothetical protein SDC9_108275 [bioreactor metagenome]|uniref:Uncharacterized protein n=1 Tax=bioreactor metagenome TaxID=1076179 RepID=A0A645B7P0_9ZZZZ
MLEATYRPGSPIDMLFSPFSSASPIASIIMCFGPRILLGLVAAYLFKALSATKMKSYLSISISALTATICHTSTVLILLSVLFAAFPLSSLLGIIIGVNALLEMAAAILITAAVTYPLLRFSNKPSKIE